LWLQWDYGDGPVITSARTVLFCAWLAWSRYRVVVPLRDKTLPSVVIGLDRALRRVDGVPTYALTDNEKTVTVEHVCGIAVIAKADLVPTDHNLRDEYRDFAELEQACEQFMMGGCWTRSRSSVSRSSTS
jgi:hypothetical protein